MLPLLGDMPIREITPYELQTAIAVYELMGNVNTNGVMIATFRLIFDYALDKGYVKENIALNLSGTQKPSPNKIILDDSEIRTFFSYCDASDSMYGYLLGFVLCTGVRIGEALAVSYSNMDRELWTLVINQQIQNGELKLTTKTRHGRKFGAI